MATEALFLQASDVKKFTSLNGNVDEDKFIQYVKIAQDIHLLNYVGQNLFEKLQDDILNSTLTGDYLTLVNTYIKPLLIHWAMVEYLPWAAYSISNKGVFKHGAENSESVNKGEVDYLQGKEMEVAQSYTRRFIDYMNINYALFPEYSTNGAFEVHPDKEASFGGWFLD